MGLQFRTGELHRRGHRDTIATARIDRPGLSAQVVQLEAHLPSLDVELQQARTDLATAAAELTNPDTEQRTNKTQAAFDQDAMLRGRAAATNPSPLLVRHLGPPPSSGPEAEAWMTAAGRVAQHHTLFPVREGEILGRRPRAMGQDDYAVTYYAVQRAVADLDRAVGIHRDPPGRAIPGVGL